MFSNIHLFNKIIYIALIYDLQLWSQAIILHAYYIKILCVCKILQVFCNKTETQS